jgi:putative ABC transport system permease protein
MPDWREVVREHVTPAQLSPTAEADMIDELSQHLEQRYDELLARGTSPAHAERDVLRELDSSRDLMRAARASRSTYATPEPVGSARGGLLTGLGNDVRVAFRLLLRNPGFALAAVLTLAIGIGANTAIFGMVDAVLLRAWPFADPDRLVIVWETDRASSTTHEPASWPDIADFDERSRTLESRGKTEVELGISGSRPSFLVAA